MPSALVTRDWDPDELIVAWTLVEADWRRWRWPRGEPAFPMTIAGHGRIRHTHLPNPYRLVELAGHVPEEWGLLLVIDAHGRRWTLYSPDPDYTAMFAPAAHTLNLEFAVFTEKFPGWNSGWHVS